MTDDTGQPAGRNPFRARMPVIKLSYLGDAGISTDGESNKQD